MPTAWRVNGIDAFARAVITNGFFAFGRCFRSRHGREQQSGNDGGGNPADLQTQREFRQDGEGDEDMTAGHASRVTIHFGDRGASYSSCWK